MILQKKLLKAYKRWCWNILFPFRIFYILVNTKKVGRESYVILFSLEEKTNEQMTSHVMEGGNYLRILYVYNYLLVNHNWLVIQSTGSVTPGHRKWDGMTQDVERLQNEDRTVLGVMKINLPFVCEQDFITDTHKA